MKIEPTSLERSVLRWLAANAAAVELREQLEGALITGRSFSGAGSYTEIAVSPNAPSLPSSIRLFGETGPIEGPEVQSGELPSGACTLLWLVSRRACTLEIAGPGLVESHPEQFTLGAPPNGDA
jgi:hypothetical protein